MTEPHDSSEDSASVPGNGGAGSSAGQGAPAVRPNLRSSTLDTLKSWCEGRDFPAFRATQIAGWLYNRPLVAVEEMGNLPLVLRDALQEDFDAVPPALASPAESVDGTHKFLVALGDSEVVESVIIPREDRRTLCISSQVGCALDCSFCATARLGLRRNLDSGEIIAQVMLAREIAKPWPLTNFVFMGMGEPLANYDRLTRALEIMTARWGLGISPRRITVSTAGLVPQLQRLARETSVNLAVSLTAARDELRDELIPINRRYPLDVLMDACRNLDIPRRKRITFEYTMLDGVNDSDRDVDDLKRLFHGMRVKLNLIPFNEFPGAPYKPTPWERIVEFQNRLLAADIHTTVRASRGRDIAAACGQLASSSGIGRKRGRSGPSASSNPS